MFNKILFAFVIVTAWCNPLAAQAGKKANPRPAAVQKPTEPFEKADVATMASRCAVIDSEAGKIALEFFPESAPETVRNFLNLASLGAFDTTTFSRVLKDFVIQGGNLGTRSLPPPPGLRARAARNIPDEPSEIKHVRGILSMARPEEPNMASSHFFIVVKDSPFLDGKYAAFGRVTSGMDVADQINQAPGEGETPLKPVRVNKISVMKCVGQGSVNGGK